MTEKMSIIIPTYNRATMLPHAIESVLSQAYTNFQIIIADDGSIDNTEAVIQKYLVDPRIIYFKNPINIGCHPNIRKALYEYTNGKYIFILSDDTYLIDPNYFSNAITMMIKHHSKLLLSNFVIVFDENGKRQTFKDNQALPELTTGESMYFGWCNPILLNSSTAIFERNYAITYLNPYDKNIVFADQELWLRFFLSPKCNVSFLKTHSVAFLSHFNSMTMKQNLEDFIDGLVWCTSTEDLAKQQFNPTRVMNHVDFLLKKSLLNAVGPIITFKNFFTFLHLLKDKNPRAYNLFLPALLKSPSRLFRLLLSSIPSLYRTCIKLRFQLRKYKEGLV